MYKGLGRFGKAKAHQKTPMQRTSPLVWWAAGRRFLARGQVVKRGRTIMVCTGEVMVVRDRTAVLDEET